MIKKKKTIAKKVVKAPKTETPVEKTIADVVVPNTGEVILSYSLESNGEDWVELATNMAMKKGLEVRFS